MKNLGRIIAPLISILQTSYKSIEINFLSTKARDNELNKEVKDDSKVSRAGQVDGINSGNKNLSNTKKLTNLAKSKKLNLAKAKNFAIVNPSKIDFLIFKAKKVFIHL